jgi:hypothetical protein
MKFKEIFTLKESDKDIKELKNKLKKDGPGVSITLDGRETVFVNKIKGNTAYITVEPDDGFPYEDTIDINTAIFTID